MDNIESYFLIALDKLSAMDTWGTWKPGENQQEAPTGQRQSDRLMLRGCVFPNHTYFRKNTFITLIKTCRNM